VALAAVAALFATASTATPASRPPAAPYSGLGTWISIYSRSSHADPQRLAAALAARKVHTLYVQTGNYGQSVDVVRPAWAGALIDAMHERKIAVVAWYLPSFTHPAVDLRRALAAARLLSPRRERFDSFALDIEASLVRDAGERTRRLLALSARLRAAVGPGYPLGAIIPSPVGMRRLRHYWPGFPYAGLARLYDAFVPMAYYSSRVHGPAAVARYARRSVAIIRAESGRPAPPIHVIGGMASATSTGEATAFVETVVSCGVAGFSLYDYAGTRPAVWRVLDRPGRTG
jgi:hypothetical protein